MSSLRLASPIILGLALSSAPVRYHQRRFFEYLVDHRRGAEVVPVVLVTLLVDVRREQKLDLAHHGFGVGNVICAELQQNLEHVLHEVEELLAEKVFVRRARISGRPRVYRHNIEYLPSVSHVIEWPGSPWKLIGIPNQHIFL